MVLRRAALLAALVSADGLVLAGLRPRLGRLAAHLAHPHAWAASAGSDRALAELAGAALWVAAVWLGAGLLAGLAAELPGSLGRCAARIGCALLPRAVRGLIAGSAGLGVLLAPVAAGAARPAGPAGPAAPSGNSGAPSSHGSSIPAPGWPVSPAGAASGAARSTASTTTTPPHAPVSIPAPIWPSSAGPSVPRTRSTPRPATTPDHPKTRPPRGATTSLAPGNPIHVRPGDCLWLIASRRLGARASADHVAAEWPRWYAANKSVIGADPAVIRPGELLQPPPAAT